ncbi:hypothetical protein BD311DRAFT_763231 [Dichomitus squalens]|uniref:Uncharacterized protein n=1 Tax=Dichomitus squalens TaxID=114155 RepID=A0A4Q9MJN0_9APHY|nr:hypothetical protein BD311DRAFT_763231 [Dichomitus squalens]
MHECPGRKQALRLPFFLPASNVIASRHPHRCHHPRASALASAAASPPILREREVVCTTHFIYPQNARAAAVSRRSMPDPAALECAAEQRMPASAPTDKISCARAVRVTYVLDQTRFSSRSRAARGVYGFPADAAAAMSLRPVFRGGNPSRSESPGRRSGSSGSRSEDKAANGAEDGGSIGGPRSSPLPDRGPSGVPNTRQGPGRGMLRRDAGEGGRPEAVSASAVYAGAGAKAGAGASRGAVDTARRSARPTPPSRISSTS